MDILKHQHCIMIIKTPVTPGRRPYCASTATENGPRAHQGRHKRGRNVVETPDIVLWSPMIANDRVTAFVLSMLKPNAKVRRSDLERDENAVGSRRS